MFIRRSIHILLFLAGVSVCAAQNGITGNPQWQIKPVFNQGFILVHRISIGHLVKGFPAIYELNFSKPALGNKLWHHENNLPDMGITAQCLDFRNPSQLGYALTLAPYIEIPLSEKQSNSRLIMRLSWGATYITRRFDIRENHKNIAIGSRVNCFAQFRWFWHLPITPNLRFEPGISFTHVSNGRAKNPNLGLNVMSLNAGFNYLIPGTNRPPVNRVDSNTRVSWRNELLLVAAMGFNQRAINTPALKTYMVSLAWQRNVRNTHKFSGGVDIFRDENYVMDYELAFNRAAGPVNGTRASVRAGYSYNVGRVSFPLEVGYYVFQKVNPDAMLVSRIGVRYYMANHLVAHFGLRTHFAVAYNFEFGLGYRFALR